MEEKIDTSIHLEEEVLVDFLDTQQQLNSSTSSSNNESFQLQQIQQQQYIQQLVQETERLRIELDRVSIEVNISMH